MYNRWTKIVAIILAALMAVSGLGAGLVALFN